MNQDRKFWSFSFFFSVLAGDISEYPRKGFTFMRFKVTVSIFEKKRKRKRKREIASHYEISFPSSPSFPFRDSRLHRSTIFVRNLCKKSGFLLSFFSFLLVLFSIVYNRIEYERERGKELREQFPFMNFQEHFTTRLSW